MSNIKVVNLNEKFSSFSEYWEPKIVGELNGQLVKLAKLKGAFMMHNHTDEDEMFLVTKGTLKMKLEEETLVINEGEFVIIPRGTNHNPIADSEVEILLFEPASTINTGDIINDRTVHTLDKI